MKILTSNYEFADNTKLEVTTNIETEIIFQGDYEIKIIIKTNVRGGRIEKKMIKHFILQNLSEISNEIIL